jgi:hypothetical protein
VPTDQATSTLVATTAATGHLAAVEHRPPRPVEVRTSRRVVLQVDRRFFKPRVVAMPWPLNN